MRAALSLGDLTPGLLHELLATAQDIRRHPPLYSTALAGRVIGLIRLGTAFHLSIAAEVAVVEMGGTLLQYNTSDLGKRWSGQPAETGALVRHSLDGAIVIAPSEWAQTFAGSGPLPVVAACCGHHSPLDALAMLFTIRRRLGALAGKKIAVIGDGASVANGALLAGGAAGMTVAVAHPRGFAPDSEDVVRARDMAARTGGAILVTEDPMAAIEQADVVVVDAWNALGGGRDREHRAAHFVDFGLTETMLEGARPQAMVLHQGPVSVPEELTEGLLRAHGDLIADWARNRIHVAKALLLHALRPGV